MNPVELRMILGDYEEGTRTISKIAAKPLQHRANNSKPLHFGMGMLVTNFVDCFAKFNIDSFDLTNASKIQL